MRHVFAPSSPRAIVEHRETTTAPAIAVARQAEAVTLFASVETSEAAHDPDDDAAKHAFSGIGLASQNCSLSEICRWAFDRCQGPADRWCVRRVWGHPDDGD